MGGMRSFMDVAAERERQIAKGYDDKHDDNGHEVGDFHNYIDERLHINTDDERQNLVEIAALAIAAIDMLDRQEKRNAQSTSK